MVSEIPIVYLYNWYDIGSTSFDLLFPIINKTERKRTK